MRQFTSQEIKEFVSKPLFDEKVILNKDSSWPRITIITPSYNQGRYLEQTILSVLNQNYPNLEYIIMDGGSSDNSVEIIRKYEKHLAFWISERDDGQADAINKGFTKSTGNILAWQNSDDIYLPNAFFVTAEVFWRQPTASLVFGNMKLIDEEDGVCGELRFVPFSRWSLTYEGTMLANQAAFWRRELLGRAGSLDVSLNFCMDYEFFLRASLHGRFKFIRHFLGAFRIQEESKSSTMAQVGMQEHAEVLRQLKTSVNGSRKAQLLKFMSMSRRAIYYAIQGDMDYLIWGAIRRWKASGGKSNLP